MFQFITHKSCKIRLTASEDVRQKMAKHYFSREIKEEELATTISDISRFSN